MNLNGGENMQKIKTPVGVVIVDDYSKFITETEFNKLSSSDKSAFTYYITNSDGTYLLKVCREGKVVENSTPILLSTSEPQNNSEGTIWVEKLAQSTSNNTVVISDAQPESAAKGSIWIQQIESYNNNEGLIVSNVQPTARAGQVWINTSNK